MSYFFITLAVLSICIFSMAIGVILSNKPLKGSCGGLGKIMGLKCSFCSEKEKCKKESMAEDVA